MPFSLRMDYDEYACIVRYGVRTFLWTAIALGVSLAAVGQSQYKVLWSFAGSPTGGDTPLGSLISDGAGHLFGTTRFGGAVHNLACERGCGTVFVLTPNVRGSWSEHLLYSFCQKYDASNEQCLDGEYPQAGLVIDGGGNLYGTTYGGGPGCSLASYGCGTVFELSPPTSPDGKWTENVLYNFCSNYVENRCLDGNFPLSQLILDTPGNLYGTTSAGGTGQRRSSKLFRRRHNI